MGKENAFYLAFLVYPGAVYWAGRRIAALRWSAGMFMAWYLLFFALPYAFPFVTLGLLAAPFLRLTVKAALAADAAFVGHLALFVAGLKIFSA
jgi:hypothetical protein